MRLLTALITIFPCLLFAQDTLSTLPPPPDMHYSSGIASIIFKLIISLAIIIGLIYLTVFLLRKISHKTMPGGNNLIKVIGKTYITPKQSLYIVKLGLSYSVLGVGENSVNFIKDLSAEEVQSLQIVNEKPKSFQNIFKSVLNK